MHMAAQHSGKEFMILNQSDYAKEIHCCGLERRTLSPRHPLSLLFIPREPMGWASTGMVVAFSSTSINKANQKRRVLADEEHGP